MMGCKSLIIFLIPSIAGLYVVTRGTRLFVLFVLNVGGLEVF
ncbi:unnamed protein product [Staurois parvus]|uniref:NADH dehydrogenase subunit 1 n=1 Tax=Staurois parvus TaxID=386267 RepID=A0ABN9BLA9_9NEOB|nr:unnamed protein product [Staurois parvus]